VDEGRKRVLLIAASILAARKVAQYEGGSVRGRDAGSCHDERDCGRDPLGRGDTKGDRPAMADTVG
jgi:hypothetical protein